jgi:hypothetical protein
MNHFKREVLIMWLGWPVFALFAVLAGYIAILFVSCSEESGVNDEVKEVIVDKGTFSAIKVSGSEALAVLEKRRAAYLSTGEYPFLIGDADDLDRATEHLGFIDDDPNDIIQASFKVDLDRWIADLRKEAVGWEFSEEVMLGEWPGESREKGSVGLHKEILTGKIKMKVFVGSAKIEEPWQLPAYMKYGNWNACPAPSVHCAFFRKWQREYGAQIVGMSNDVIECKVADPPRDREAAVELAWEQFWYCEDIVYQGCETIHNLAATLLNSPYWYFWWD